MPISRNLSSGRNLYRLPQRAKRLRSAKEPRSMDLMLRGVRYGPTLSLTLGTPLTIDLCRQHSPPHPQLPPFPRTNVSPATTTDPSGRSSNVKNAASKPTRERLVSSRNHWMWTIGCASCARMIKCKRRRWIRLVCFVPRSSMTLKMGFIRLRIRSCARRNLQRDRDGCM